MSKLGNSVQCFSATHPGEKVRQQQSSPVSMTQEHDTGEKVRVDVSQKSAFIQCVSQMADI
jgi:hypothetical protein